MASFLTICCKDVISFAINFRIQRINKLCWKNPHKNSIFEGYLKVKDLNKS